MKRAKTRAALISALAKVANQRIEEKTPEGCKVVLQHLADRAGINSQTLRNFLQGRNESTSDESIIAVFRALGMGLTINVVFEYEIEG